MAVERGDRRTSIDQRVSYPIPHTPVSIKRDRWAMQPAIDRGVRGTALRVAEREFWRSNAETERRAEAAPQYTQLFPDTQWLGNGWEWNVFSLPGHNMVVKIPRGVFPEVNAPEHLVGAQEAYAGSLAHIAPFVVETAFVRMEEMGTEGTNVIFQRQLATSKPTSELDPKELTPQVRTAFGELGEGLMQMLDVYEWIPDIQLERTKEGIWKLYDVIIEHETPRLYDFSEIGHPLRLSPERTGLEVPKTKALLEAFVADMSR